MNAFNSLSPILPVGAIIIFNQLVSSSGPDFNYNTLTGNVTFNTPVSDYKITYGLSVDTNLSGAVERVAPFVSGVPLVQGLYTIPQTASPGDTGLFVVSCIFAAQTGDVLNVRNIGPGVLPLSGGPLGDLSAYLILEKVS